jgi:hypothetical protein
LKIKEKRIMEFNIGDRIMVKEYEDIPQENKVKSAGDDFRLFTTRKASLCGQHGEVVDRYYSEALGCYGYKLKFDGSPRPSLALFDGDSLIPEEQEEEAGYHFEFDILENLVSARFYEDKGDKTSLICRGHGHIFHDGAVGVAQAASYALKRILEKLNDGYYDLRKTEGKKK